MPLGLDDLIRTAIADDDFWHRLNKDLDSTLQQDGYTLSPHDRQRLAEALASGEITVNVDALLKGMRDGRIHPLAWIASCIRRP